MSTRRPKVPRPAGQSGAAPRRSGSLGGQRAAVSPKPAQAKENRTEEVQGTAPSAARPLKTGTAGNRAEAAGASGRKPSQPKPSQPKPSRPGKPAKAAKTKPANPSEARAAARQELAAEIRRDVPAADTTPALTRDEPTLKPVPAKSFSGRLLALGIVMVVITVLLAPSVRTFLQQRSEIAALEAEIAREQETGEELQEALSRWEDPAFIKAQARERIFLVMPGETRYLVKGEHSVEDVEEAAAQAPQDLQWVDALWDSVVRSATAP
ncbi:septum formation initiator family protein [Arthrobacter koreensis]|uniref:Septum formation initiator family protein n=2 Tax=Arthrobacter koreensis TaxID=199136 RepID=A0ABY6FUQ7_9MICC|nr:septum formation initiator family protein [Arthrobacter koreensis]UYB36964.1 septum formation initiator family protein [Arthrobacter koreensis]